MVEILYSDNHLLVVNKPAGMLTQPDHTDRKSLEEICKEWVKKEFKKPGNVFLEAIFRIDRPVSGIVVFGRTSKAVSRMKASVRNKETKKVYLGFVEGDIPDQGVFEDYLYHDDFRARVVSETTKGAKFARLSYRVLMREKGVAQVEIDLETGRYHQIRVQFGSRGFPIVGDKKYGSKRKYQGEGIALHHCRFSIPHPTKKDVMVFKEYP